MTHCMRLVKSLHVQNVPFFSSPKLFASSGWSDRLTPYARFVVMVVVAIISCEPLRVTEEGCWYHIHDNSSG